MIVVVVVVVAVAVEHDRRLRRQVRVAFRSMLRASVGEGLIRVRPWRRARWFRWWDGRLCTAGGRTGCWRGREVDLG